MTNQPQSFTELAKSNPKEAALLQTVVTAAVKNVEHHLGDLPAEEKKKKAEAEAIDMLRKVYDGVDLFFNLHPAVDFLAKECLIPLIPGAIDGIVALFNKTGEFDHSAQGVA